MNFNNKERKLLLLTLSILCFWGLYAFMVQPARARIGTLNRVIPEKQVQLQELLNKSKQYNDLNNNLKNLHQITARQPDNFSLVTYLEKLVKNNHLEKALVTMDQQSDTFQENFLINIVTIELNNITMSQLIKMLTPISAAPAMLHIKTMNIEKSPDQPKLLIATIQISHLETLTPEN